MARTVPSVIGDLVGLARPVVGDGQGVLAGRLRRRSVAGVSVLIGAPPRGCSASTVRAPGDDARRRGPRPTAVRAGSGGDDGGRHRAAATRTTLTADDAARLRRVAGNSAARMPTAASDDGPARRAARRRCRTASWTARRPRRRGSSACSMGANLSARRRAALVAALGRLDLPVVVASRARDGRRGARPARSSVMNDSWAIGLPGQSTIGTRVRLVISRVSVPRQPGSTKPAVAWTMSPRRPSELLPSMRATRSSGSSTHSSVRPRHELAGVDDERLARRRPRRARSGSSAGRRRSIASTRKLWKTRKESPSRRSTLAGWTMRGIPRVDA